ncbi:hypothetical protein D9M72_484070 [compost metagenome]
MPGVSMVAAGLPCSASSAAARNLSSAGPSMPITRPGLVQNWPTPSTSESTSWRPISSPRASSAAGSRNTGLMLLISAYTGIGCGRALAVRINAMPPAREPVKPTAWIAGFETSAVPMTLPAPTSSENTPSGRPAACTAFWITRPTSSDVPRWAECALTTTGQPAASAAAVSPPATEKASGKLLAPNTATGPMAMRCMRRSGRGGLRSGSAGSKVACCQRPSRSTVANRRSWPAVRPRSPCRRAIGSALSRWARSISVSPSASMPVAMVSRNAARCSGVVLR